MVCFSLKKEHTVDKHHAFRPVAATVGFHFLDFRVLVFPTFTTVTEPETHGRRKRSVLPVTIGYVIPFAIPEIHERRCVPAMSNIEGNAVHVQGIITLYKAVSAFSVLIASPGK